MITIEGEVIDISAETATLGLNSLQKLKHSSAEVWYLLTVETASTLN